jgi:hypothetical protein
MAATAPRPTTVAVVAPAGIGNFPLVILPDTKKWEAFQLLIKIFRIRTAKLVFGKDGDAVTYVVPLQFLKLAHDAVRAAANGGPSPFGLTCQVSLECSIPNWQPQIGTEEQFVYDALGVPVLDIEIGGKVWTVHGLHIHEALAHLDAPVPPAALAAPAAGVPVLPAAGVPPAAGVVPPAAPAADALLPAAGVVPPTAGVLPPAAPAAGVVPPAAPAAGVPRVELHATTSLSLQNFFKEKPPAVIMALATILSTDYVQMGTEDVSYWVLTGHHSTNSTLRALGLLGPQA